VHTDRLVRNVDPKKSQGHIVQQPVESWSSREALKVDARRGNLTPAVRQPGIVSLQPCSRVVGTIPASSGWSVELNSSPNSDQPDTEEYPIVGWVVDDEGDARPIIPVTGRVKV
jgi:hypothetical protein